MIKFDKISFLQTTKLIEIILLTLIIPIIGFSQFPQDPFLLQNDFLWFIIPLSLLIMRYGFWVGLCSISLYVISIMFYYYPNSLNVSIKDITSFILGPTLLMIGIGLFSDLKIRQSKKTLKRLNSMKQQLEQHQRDLFLLKKTHDQLQEKLATGFNQPQDPIDNFIEKYQKKNGLPPVCFDLEILISRLMPLYSQLESIQSATLHQLLLDGNINQIPTSTYGRRDNLSSPVKSHHPLIQQALKQDKLVYQGLHLVKPEQEDEIELVLPLVDSYHKVWAVLIVYSLSPIDFDHEVIDRLNYLGRLSGDLLRECFQKNIHAAQ